MEDFMFSYKAIVFIRAWKTWDEAALRYSASAEVARKNGKIYYMPAMALKGETDAFLEAKEAFAQEIGVSHVHLMRALHELRHDGVDYAKCVRLVLEYIGALSGTS